MVFLAHKEREKSCIVHCTEVGCIWRVETPFDSFICSRSHNLALIQLFDELPQLYITSYKISLVLSVLSFFPCKKE